MRERSARGLLTQGDIKRLATAIRSGSVGPTVVYYAGVTAPVISASVALVSRRILSAADATTYWQVMLSAIIAAMAGIVWYLIFTRLSYRHQFGRGTEISVDTEISLTDDALTIRRDDITTQIGWTAVRSIDSWRKYTVVRIVGADALIIPNRWFDDDTSARLDFVARLNELTSSSQLRLT